MMLLQSIAGIDVFLASLQLGLLDGLLRGQLHEKLFDRSVILPSPGAGTKRLGLILILIAVNIKQNYLSAMTSDFGLRLINLNFTCVCIINIC